MGLTWVYNAVTKTWSEGPKMNTERYHHSCFADKTTSSIHVMGGKDNQWNILNSTEMWTLGQKSWQPSANLPEAIDWSSAVASNTDEFVGYMAGGVTRSRVLHYIYGLRRGDMTWIKSNNTIKMGRYGHSLLNIPANQVLGC